jgi:hypothetical protein
MNSPRILPMGRMWDSHRVTPSRVSPTLFKRILTHYCDASLDYKKEAGGYTTQVVAML